MKNINFVPKDTQRILSRQKNSEKYKEQEVFFIKSFIFLYRTPIKHFAIFTGKHLCWSLLLIKIIKKNLQHRCFLLNMARFLRASILWNICKRLFERFSRGTNNTIVKLIVYLVQRCSLLRIFSENMTKFGHFYRTNL